jgi:transforming growth factor-beta-induced protein
MKKPMRTVAALAALTIVVAACGGTDTAETSTTDVEATTTTVAGTETTEAMMDDTIASVVAGDERFSTLLAAVEAAGLTDTLADADAEFTVFAPTNDAFAAALEALDLSAEELLSGDNLADILTYHVLAEKVTAADLLAGGAGEVVVETVQGDLLTIVVTDSDEVQFPDAGGSVIEADIEVGNGVIHVIDVVLLPPS